VVVVVVLPGAEFDPVVLPDEVDPVVPPEPAVGPAGAAAYVNQFGCVTRTAPDSPSSCTSTLPAAAAAGAVTVIAVSVAVPVITAATAPNWTPETADRPEPLMVTAVPPATGPEAGLMFSA
jgi:hypothetical protein